MDFEWDEKKNTLNQDKHGVSFKYVAAMFNHPILTHKDTRTDYGEDRLISLGCIDDDVFCVTYTIRNEKIRIISAWKGGRKEYERYHNHITG